jgi:hypothetical protein
LEEIGWATVDQWGDPRSSNAGLYPTYKLLREAEFHHYCKQEIVTNSVKGVGKIQLDYHSLLSFFTACMNGFLNENYIVQDLSPSDKASLIFQDQLWEDFLNPVCNYLCDNFIPSVAKGYRSEPVESLCPFFFWDECEK